MVSQRLALLFGVVGDVDLEVSSHLILGTLLGGHVTQSRVDYAVSMPVLEGQRLRLRGVDA